MKEAYEPFQQRHILEQSQHPYDTQKNEGMNNTVAKYAPKSKTYSRSMSLQN